MIEARSARLDDSKLTRSRSATLYSRDRSDGVTYIGITAVK